MAEERTIETKRGNMYNNKSRQQYMAQPNVKEFNRVVVKKALTTTGGCDNTEKGKNGDDFGGGNCGTQQIWEGKIN